MVVAGFQGVDENGNITTLGRGGSDTTAVALAAALKATSARFTPMSTGSTPPIPAWLTVRAACPDHFRRNAGNGQYGFQGVADSCGRVCR